MSYQNGLSQLLVIQDMRVSCCKGVVCPTPEINFSKCEVSSNSECCNLNLSSLSNHIWAAYAASENIGTVTNESWQHESRAGVRIALLDHFDLL